MFYSRTNKMQLGVVVVLAGLLLTLASFQYSWLGQLSEREQERMGQSLDFATRAVRFEFDNELAELYRTFQVDYREDGTFPEQLVAHYTERVETIEGPDILEKIYWVNLNEETGLVLQEFTGVGLETLNEWPEDIAQFRDEFDNLLQYNDAQFRLLLGPEPLQDDVPALVIQQVFTRPTRDLEDYKSISWIVAKLRPNVITGELIPALANQYIYGEETLDYNIGIIDRDEPAELVYQSRPGLTAASFAEPDAERDIYGLRSWNFNQRFQKNRRMWAVIEEKSDAKWDLLVKHQAGSLEAAVAATRNRNLAISLGVFTLLASAIAMIMVSTRRAQRLAAQQMEFVAGVSHELRTPLAVIRTAAENLADDVVHDAEKTRQYGALINREGRRLSNMVERVLLFAKMRADNLQFEHQAVDLIATIEDAIDSNNAQFTERSVTVRKELPESLPELMGDPSALGSVMQNLISNAIKYSCQGGTVTIQARESKTESGTAIQIAIHDQGAGIPNKEIPYLFDPFFRGERARQTQTQGSGLGLSLVKQVVEAHGGEIDVSSTPGAGSTFVIHLPVVNDSETVGPPLH
jgi:signal transduction histidine kinase